MMEVTKGYQLMVRLNHSASAPMCRLQFSVNYYSAIDRVYAATVYKAQGVTLDRSHVLASMWVGDAVLAGEKSTTK